MVRSEGVRRITTAIQFIAVFQFVALILFGIYDALVAHTIIREIATSLIPSAVIGAALLGVAWIIKGFNTTQKQL